MLAPETEAYLSTPRTASGVCIALGLPRRRVHVLLKRGVDAGRLERVGTPLTYVVADAQPTLFAVV